MGLLKDSKFSEATLFFKNLVFLLGEPTVVAGEPMEGIEGEKHTVVKWNTNTPCEQTQASTPRKHTSRPREGCNRK